MKKEIFLALSLSLVLVLSACGAPSGGTPSDSGTQDTPSAAVPDNTPANDASDSQDSATEDFLKTITAETAEYKGVCGADLTWYYQDGVLVIKGTGEMSDSNSIEFDGGIFSNLWLDNMGNPLCDKIHWVIMDNEITSIGRGAFYHCEMLSKISLPDGLKKIDSRAFAYCCQLSEITIPSSVEYIGDNAFSYSNGQEFIKTVTFLGDAPEGAVNLIKSVVRMDGAGTVYYSGSSFDELIAEWPELSWVKK